MKAIPLGNKIEIKSENASDVATMREVESTLYIRIAGSAIEHDPNSFLKRRTLIIGADYHPPDQQVNELRHQLELLQHVADAIPPCPIHGVGCLPHMVQWIEGAKRLLAAVETVTDEPT